MAYTIKRVQNFESDYKKYTAWITVDNDMNVVYKPEELSELFNLPQVTWSPVVIKNDNDPNDYYMVECGGSEEMFIYHHYITSFGREHTDEIYLAAKVDEKELDSVTFDERDNTLHFYFGEDEDDSSYEIPCNVALAAFILSGSVFEEYLDPSSMNHLAKSMNYLTEEGFPDIPGYHEFIFES